MPTRHKRPRSQRRIKGVQRTPLPTCVIDKIWSEVDKTARRFGVSRSFVVAVALADAMGIELEPEDRFDEK